MTRGLHVGFRAPSREAVDAFWQAGIDAGYRDDGAPGPRTAYGPDYYGGFLLDPDGNSAEAVLGAVAVGVEQEAAVVPGSVDMRRPARRRRGSPASIPACQKAPRPRGRAHGSRVQAAGHAGARVRGPMSQSSHSTGSASA